MDGSLISPENGFGLVAAFLSIAAFGFWSEGTKLGKLLSGVILTIGAGALMSNLRVIPFASPVHDLVWSYAVPLAIPLLLFKADLRRIIPEAGPLLLAFTIAAAGTLAGAIAGFHLIDLGPLGPKIAGTLSASWIGGSMNFAAVSQALELNDGPMLGAMAASDNVGGTLFLTLLVLLPGSALIRRSFPSHVMDEAPGEDEAIEAEERKHFHIADLATALALSALCCLAGYTIAGLAGIPQFGVLFVTLAALLLANVFPARMHGLNGDFDLGMYFMYIFFGVVGAGADVLLMVRTALPVFAFTGIMATVHLAFVLGGAKLFRIDLAEALIASNACALGPATAAAQAASQRWRSLVTPAIMLGILGYATANFIGVALAKFLG
ncbi:DUF819 domain-containing protein [Parvibaculum sp.]|uniref:DUF819 family protein n=1 Tax=Parvibaculum sp. TaxID=2024848 RepID=UPI002C4F5576|nr:DUF819 family protein [Parvibaculum sp.]HUD50395.1 DUF819 family protein [Parvibaculum sp.]